MRWIGEAFLISLTVGIFTLSGMTGYVIAGKQAATEPTAISLERMITRASEIGLVAFIAIWLLRVVITDLRADIRKIETSFMDIAMQSQRAGGELLSEIREANQKLEELTRSIDRLERKKEEK